MLARAIELHFAVPFLLISNSPRYQVSSPNLLVRSTMVRFVVHLLLVLAQSHQLSVMEK